MSTRSVAQADVAELSGNLGEDVEEEKNFHLVIVSTNKVLSTTQFKQMFYSRGDDFFQIANVYECPDCSGSIYSSVWGIDCKDPHAPMLPSAAGLVEMGKGDDGVGRLNHPGGGGYSQSKQSCYNFNKLGGRDDDPEGIAWAYSYIHDQARNFFAQHEAMGFLEQDTCVKRDRWTSCSRLSIEDQLYGLAFASETDQDLCLKVTCARRWSEVEDALAESCAAADSPIKRVLFTARFNGVRFDSSIPGNNGFDRFFYIFDNGVKILKYSWANLGAGNHFSQFQATLSAASPTVAGQTTTGAGGTVTSYISGYEIAVSPLSGSGHHSTGDLILEVTNSGEGSGGGPILLGGGNSVVSMPDENGNAITPPLYPSERILATGRPQGFVDLYINIRVTNGHPEALDTIFRIRFTIGYVFHVPSALHTWNTRSSKAAAGVIQSGVEGDAPEGGKEQAEDTSITT